MAAVVKFIDDLCKTNGKWNPAVCGWVLVGLAFLFLEFWEVIALQRGFDAANFGIGAGSILGGGGLGSWFHSKSHGPFPPP